MSNKIVYASQNLLPAVIYYRFRDSSSTTATFGLLDKELFDSNPCLRIIRFDGHGKDYSVGLPIVGKLSAMRSTDLYLAMNSLGELMPNDNCVEATNISFHILPAVAIKFGLDQNSTESFSIALFGMSSLLWILVLQAY